MRHSIPVPGGRPSLAAAVFATATVSLALVAGLPTAAGQTTITVDTTSDTVDFGDAQTVTDLPGPDGRTSLREAAIASTNTPGADAIGFAIPTSDPGFDGTGFTIGIDPGSDAEQLTLGDDGTVLDATTQPGGHSITVVGSEQAKTDERVGLLITSSGNTVRGLGLRLYGSAVRVDGRADNLVTAVTARDNNNGVQFLGRTVAGGNTLADSTLADNDRTAVAFVNALGGTVDGNTITDNTSSGVLIFLTPDVTVSDNLISGNSIGIRLTNGDVQGGTATGNTVTGNRTDGLSVDGENFTVSRNAVFANADLGIDVLGGHEDAFGVTKNSRGGPNFPIIRHADSDGATTTVTGTVDYADPQSVTIELFASDAPDPSGHGEGQRFVSTLTADAKGRFTATLPGSLDGQYVTATATAPGRSTSEFSAAVRVG